MSSHFSFLGWFICKVWDSRDLEILWPISWIFWKGWRNANHGFNWYSNPYFRKNYKERIFIIRRKGLKEHKQRLLIVCYNPINFCVWGFWVVCFIQVISLVVEISGSREELTPRTLHVTISASSPSQTLGQKLITTTLNKTQDSRCNFTALAGL